METTVGQILINEGLPEPMRDFNRVMDKKTVRGLMQDVYDRYPDQYKPVVQHLMNVGSSVAQADGSSFTLQDFITPTSVNDKRQALRMNTEALIDKGDIPGVEKLLVDSAKSIESDLYDQLLSRKNPFALQVFSGSRGSKSQLRSLMAGDVSAVDGKGKLIPIPIVRSYAEGRDPVEYWAGTYGSRDSLLRTKFAIADSGAWSKQVAAAAHRIIAADAEPPEGTGFPIDVDDPDLSGYVLARDAGSYKAGEVLTPSKIADLKDEVDQVLVHSPISAGSFHGGIPRKAFGIRENGTFPNVGDTVGMKAAQAIGERLAQTSLNSKHGGGIVGSRGGVSGFDLINNLVQVPKKFKGGGTVSSIDGIVDGISPAPQGGIYVTIGGKKHYVIPELTPTVKIGQRVEAGEMISDGYPNPADLVTHLGIGEGRRQFVNVFMKALRENQVPIHRRNAEVLARALINHVKIKDLGIPGYLPEDTIEYDRLQETYEPRDGSENKSLHSAIGSYLEKPTLWYSIGTRITPTVAEEMKKHKVSEVLVHSEPPLFEPDMVRVLENLSAADDVLVRLAGTYLQRGLVESVHRGRSSDTKGVSYYPSIAVGEL